MIKNGRKVWFLIGECGHPDAPEAYKKLGKDFFLVSMLNGSSILVKKKSIEMMRDSLIELLDNRGTGTFWLDCPIDDMGIIESPKEFL